MRALLFCLLYGCASVAFAADNIVNVYTWAGVIPDSTIQQFEKETGIKVNFSTFDSNEIMYAKLKSSVKSAYDVIEPSSDFIDRMRQEGMLEKLDKQQLSWFKNLNPSLLNQAYDPHNNYSLPFVWGITGIFVNRNYYPAGSVTAWADFWDPKYRDQLFMQDDTRGAFDVALQALGYSANEKDPEHIKQAYLKLKALYPNIKLFNTNAAISIYIDEDATLGMAWNGDVNKASQENPKVEFVYPKEGFVIWVDNFAIPKDAPHRENAYKFLNFMLRADVAKQVSLDNGYATPNLAAQKLLPPEIRNNKTIYPTPDTLRHGQFEVNLGDEATALYEKYWELLKMGG